MQSNSIGEHDSPQQLKSPNVTKSILIRESTTNFAGPLPPPEVLAKYEAIEPGFANRIVEMAEKQAEHRQEQEKKIVTADIKDGRLGIWLAFILSFTTIIAGVLIAIYADAAIIGTVLSSFGMVCLAGVFVYGTRRNK